MAPILSKECLLKLSLCYTFWQFIYGIHHFERTNKCTNLLQGLHKGNLKELQSHIYKEQNDMCMQQSSVNVAFFFEPCFHVIGMQSHGEIQSYSAVNAPMQGLDANLCIIQNRAN